MNTEYQEEAQTAPPKTGALEFFDSPFGRASNTHPGDTIRRFPAIHTDVAGNP
jgi:hypothetical protein